MSLPAWCDDVYCPRQALVSNRIFQDKKL